MLVIKRDCSLSVFDKSKITKAILNSMKKGSGVVDEDVAIEIAEEISQMYSDKEEISIYDIEENVIRLLHEKGHGLTAKLYKRYRDIREVQRNIINTTDTSIGELISGVKNEVSYDNSNKNPTINATQRDLIAGETSKDFAKRLMLPSHLVQAIETGILYYHDLDYTMQTGMFNCCLVNIGDMIDNGTVINGVMIESPKSFQVACNVITQIMAQIASNQYGK